MYKVIESRLAETVFILWTIWITRQSWGQWERGSEGPGIRNLVLCPRYEAHYLIVKFHWLKAIWHSSQLKWERKYGTVGIQKERKNQIRLSTRSLDSFTIDGDCFSGNGKNSFSNTEKSRAESAVRVRDTQAIRNAFIHLFIHLIIHSFIHVFSVQE